MSGKKSGVGSTQQWEMDLSDEGRDSGAPGGGKRKRGGRKAGGGRGRASSREEIEGVVRPYFDGLGKKIALAEQGLEDAFRSHIERSVAPPGGVLKEMLASVEQMAKEWKEASTSGAPAEGGGDAKGAKDAKDAKDTKEKSRATELVEVIEEFAGRVRTLHEDIGRARDAQRKSVAVAAAVCVLLAAPVLFGIGLAAQHQLALLPEPERQAEPDPTGGWRAYVWDRYGEEIVGCERNAVDTGVPVTCELRMTP